MLFDRLFNRGQQPLRGELIELFVAHILIRLLIAHITIFGYQAQLAHCVKFIVCYVISSACARVLYILPSLCEFAAFVSKIFYPIGVVVKGRVDGL